MLTTIRAFFAAAGVMEVQTPVLGACGVSDPHIENLGLAHRGRDYFLQTSPEYAMKRLLAAGAGPLYQLGPAFRGGETGRRHNIEFTMLEWYRPGFSLVDLMAELEALLQRLARDFGIVQGEFRRVTYAELFTERYGIDPHSLDEEGLARLAAAEGGASASHFEDRNDYLDWLFSAGIEPELREPVLVTEFPASQAVLAEIVDNEAGQRVAHRFELFINGVELANGYEELTDAGVLRARFEANNHARRQRGLPVVEPDKKLLAALPHMPASAGVALGIDRLLMVLGGKNSLDEVMPFSDARL